MCALRSNFFIESLPAKECILNCVILPLTGEPMVSQKKKKRRGRRGSLHLGLLWAPVVLKDDSYKCEWNALPLRPRVCACIYKCVPYIYSNLARMATRVHVYGVYGKLTRYRAQDALCGPRI